MGSGRLWLIQSNQGVKNFKEKIWEMEGRKYEKLTIITLQTQSYILISQTSHSIVSGS